MNNSWIKHDSLTSTNSYISDLLKHQKLDEGTVVMADYQEGGRGLGTHAWVSNRGENLLMSLLLFPEFLSASSQFHLSRVASLALCDALESVGIDSMIKWPNDILTRRGKIAGILIENGITAGNITHTIIGIGLNLNQIEFPEFQVPATSLRLETGQITDVGRTGEMVVSSLIKRYSQLRGGEIGLLERAYLKRLLQAGLPSLFISGEDVFEGTIVGVTNFGELMVDCKGEIRIYGHGAVTLQNHRFPFC
jgi:BirA family biotin operon repressor/biotin-[acetyl-CoA-carboxylase] ligase